MSRETGRLLDEALDDFDSSMSGERRAAFRPRAGKIRSRDSFEPESEKKNPDALKGENPCIECQVIGSNKSKPHGGETHFVRYDDCPEHVIEAPVCICHQLSPEAAQEGQRTKVSPWKT